MIKFIYGEVFGMNKNLFGLKVKCLREYRKLSQSKLAEKINITDAALSNLETGKSYPHINTLIAICDVLDVSIIFLISEDKDATKVCLDEIGKCLFILDDSISNHLTDYIQLCLKLDTEVKGLKNKKELVFDWYKPKD